MFIGSSSCCSLLFLRTKTRRHTREEEKKTVWFRYVDIDAKNLFLLARIATRGKVIALFAESLVFVFPHFRENLSQNKTGFSSSILFF